MKFLKQKHISEIKKLFSNNDLETIDDLNRFNEEIHKFFYDFFLHQFGDFYLYSTLLFVRDNKIINHDFLFGNDLANKNNQVRNYVENIQPELSRKLRTSKVTIGISNQLIKNKIKALVLFDKNNFDKHNLDILDEIITYNLEENINLENIKSKCNLIYNQDKNNFNNIVLDSEYYSDFIKNNSELEKLKKGLSISKIDRLKPILSLYYLSNPNQKKEPYYSYFIRPDTDHDFYNGLINIGLKRPLTSNEFATINLMLFYVFSEIAIKDFQEYSKNIEWKHIIDNLSHTQNGIYGYLFDKINTLGAIFEKYTNNPDDIVASKFHEIYKESYNSIQLLDQTNLLNLALGKYTIDYSKEKLKPELLNILTHQKFKLRDIINEISKILLVEIKSLNLNNKEHVEKAEAQLKKFLKKLYKFDEIEIYAPKTAFFIILYELFKNLIEHSNENELFFNIKIEIDKKKNGYIIFDNNNISTEYLNLIREKNIFKKTSYGLRTIFRILKSGILNKENSKKTWLLYDEKNSSNRPVIKLLIPKNYFYERK